MEDTPKRIFFVVLLIPLLLVYVYFFNNKDEDKVKKEQPNTTQVESKSEFQIDKFLESLNSKDYQIKQDTKSYKYGSTSKSKPQISASKTIYLNNGIISAGTLNIDNSVLVIYPKEKERIYIFDKDKTYYTTNEDQYGNSLLSLEEENPILVSFKELVSHKETKKVSSGVYEYKDYITPTSQTTDEQKNSPDYKTVFEQKMIFRYEFDTKTNLLKKYSILSNDRKYLIGLVSYSYKEISQEKIDSMSRIPEGYSKVEE